MKKLLSIFGLGILMSTNIMAQDTFKIHGTISVAGDGESVYLMKMTPRQTIPIDTAQVSAHKFELGGPIAGVTDVTLVYAKDNYPVSVAQVIVSPGADINVEMGATINDPARITGDRNNEIVQEVMAFEQKEAFRHQEVIRIFQDTTVDIVTRFACKQRLDSLQMVLSGNRARTIIANMPQPICGYLLQQWGSDFQEDQLNVILDAMAKKMPDDPVYKAIIENRRAQAEAEAATEVGKQFLEIALVDTKGSMVRLSEVVKANKYTLVDFWASWCRPCLGEVPNVKRVYEKYHQKGLEIYGVSLDENQLNWQNAIDRFQMPWIHVSDLKGWQSAGAKTYYIRSIPATLLIDQSGKIVAKNLRGNELEAKMAELLK